MRVLAVTLVALGLTLTTGLGAQPLEARVEAMLREGIAHRVAGRDDAAIERFEAAYAAQRAPVTAGQLALACQSVGRWVDADRYMREALSSPDDDWVRRHRRELDEAHTVVRRQVGELELRGSPEGAVVRVDGVEVGRFPLTAPLRLRAGVVILEVRAEGYFTLTRQVTINGDELAREPIALTPVPVRVAVATQPPHDEAATPVVAPPTVTAPVAHAPSRRGVPAVSWVLGGVGVAFIAGGVASFIAHEGAVERFNAAPGCYRVDTVSREMQPAACRDELAIGDWTTAGQIVGYVGGAALLGTSVALALLPRRASSGATSWGCAPSLRGVGCAITF